MLLPGLALSPENFGSYQGIGNVTADLPRLAPRFRDYGITSWHESKGCSDPSGPLQRYYHLGTYSQVVPNMQDELAVAVENIQNPHLDF